MASNPAVQRASTPRHTYAAGTAASGSGRVTLLSGHAEVAIRRLGALDGFYRDVRTGLTDARPRRPRRLGAPSARRQPMMKRTRSKRTRIGQVRTLREVTLVRCVSIVEAYAMDLGEDELYRRLDRSSIQKDALP